MAWWCLGGGDEKDRRLETAHRRPMQPDEVLSQPLEGVRDQGPGRARPTSSGGRASSRGRDRGAKVGCCYWPLTAASAASMERAASSCIPGRRWEYVSSVMPMVAWPNLSETTLGCTPCLSSSEA